MTKPLLVFAALALLSSWPLARAQDKVILAVGAHAGDMEVTAGAALAAAARQGNRVVILHLTLGENGHPRKPAAEYAKQKREEAAQAARALGAELLFGSWADGSLRPSPEAEAFVRDTIARLRATHVITHWGRGIHPDHEATHTIVRNVALLAPTVRSLLYTENWEDPQDFHPFVYVNAVPGLDSWRKAVQCYEFLRGGVSPFPYLQYYEGLSMVRGAEARKPNAVAFDIEPLGKKRVADPWP
jgi:LmbE family N-acetylglucosaminyl deacetylase